MSTPLVPKRSRHCFLLPLVLCALLPLVLCSCASLLDPGPPPARIQLSPTMPGPLMSKPLNKQVVVAMPQAGRDIDTDGIALLFNNREIRHLSGARWASPVPQMLQRELIDALTATNGLRGVAGESAGIAADARLLCDIRQFSLRYASAEAIPTAVLTATFRLLDLSSGAILDTKNVSIEVPATGRDNAAVAVSGETVLSRCLAEVAPWVVHTLDGRRTDAR